MFTRLRLALTSLFRWVFALPTPTRSQLPAEASSAATLASEREKETAAAVARLEKALAEAKAAQAELKEQVAAFEAAHQARTEIIYSLERSLSQAEHRTDLMRSDRNYQLEKRLELEAAAKFASRVEFGVDPEIAKMALNQAENAEQRKDFEKRWAEAKRETIRLMQKRERAAEFAANGYKERRDAVLATHLKFIGLPGDVQYPPCFEKWWAEQMQNVDAAAEKREKAEREREDATAAIELSNSLPTT